MSRLSMPTIRVMDFVVHRDTKAELVVEPARIVADERRSQEAYREFMTRVNVLGDTEMNRSLRGF